MPYPLPPTISHSLCLTSSHLLLPNNQGFSHALTIAEADYTERINEYSEAVGSPTSHLPSLTLRSRPIPTDPTFCGCTGRDRRASRRGSYPARERRDQLHLLADAGGHDNTMEALLLR